MRAVTFTGAGGNEVIQVVDRHDPAPVGHDVLVQVRYAGLNPADVLQRNGVYPAPVGSPADVPGLEVAGEVVSCGASVTSWEVGDRVFGLVGGGGLADNVLVHERHVAKIPSSLDEVAAAAVPEAFITAHDAIRSQAGLRMGETLLVQGASGAVGSAAIAIGKACGARVLGVARSPQGLQFVREQGAEPIPDDGFAAAVKDATEGRGADVILELVGAQHVPDNIEAAALRGRIMIVGYGAGAQAQLPLNRLLQRRAQITGTFLRARSFEDKAQAVRAFEREVIPGLSDGTLAPVIDQVFGLDQIAGAFDYLGQPGKRGKQLLRLP